MCNILPDMRQDITMTSEAVTLKPTPYKHMPYQEQHCTTCNLLGWHAVLLRSAT